MLLKRFPGESYALRRLFQGSRSFQSLCKDYRECRVALDNWQQSTAVEAPAWRQEYANLLLELEQEVGQYLENPAAFSTGPGKSRRTEPGEQVFRPRWGRRGRVIAGNKLPGTRLDDRANKLLTS